MQQQDKAIAVMQPYIFPYIGYFQLIQAVDVFVFYDDVNFIKQGWINRNKILVKNEALLFTVPLKKISSFKKINEVTINPSLYPKWKKKFLKSIEQNYSKAPNYELTYNIINNTLEGGEKKSISELAILSIKSISDYLNLGAKFELSSVNHTCSEKLDRTDLLISICKKTGIKNYINALGGQELYSKKDFLKYEINLLFLNPQIKPYSQYANDFVPGISMIDVLMFNSKKECLQLINDYELL